MEYARQQALTQILDYGERRVVHDLQVPDLLVTSISVVESKDRMTIFATVGHAVIKVQNSTYLVMVGDIYTRGNKNGIHSKLNLKPKVSKSRLMILFSM